MLPLVLVQPPLRRIQSKSSVIKHFLCKSVIKPEQVVVKKEDTFVKRKRLS